MIKTAGLQSKHTVGYASTNRYACKFVKSALPACDFGIRQVQSRRLRRLAASSNDDNEKADETVVETKKVVEEEQEELPVWVRREEMKKLQEADGEQDLPFFVYLLASGIIAIAAIGSIFEYFDKNPVFGVIPVDSPLWAPILGFFALTGLPLSGYLFFKSVTLANKAADQMDQIDNM